jgi:hypothetical protein
VLAPAAEPRHDAGGVVALLGPSQAGMDEQETERKEEGAERGFHV